MDFYQLVIILDRKVSGNSEKLVAKFWTKLTHGRSVAREMLVNCTVWGVQEDKAL